MKVRYCTLFDQRYLTRGLAMLASIDPYLRDGDEICVLAMDDHVERALAEMGRPRWRTVRIETMQDAELLAVRETRPAREFCWTCTPALAAWMVRESDDGDVVVYLDADLVFFGDPRELIDELDDGGSVLIHEHRYSPDKAHFERTSGRFNVGLVAFNVGDEARACVAHWRTQVIERCELDPENGYCGDQGYLDAWPVLYSGVRILKNIGGGVAPWNINQYKVGERDGRPTVDGQSVVFFHYHAMETLIDPRFGFVAITPSRGYSFPRNTLRVFYRPYARQIRKIDDEVGRRGFEIEGDGVRNWIDLVIGVALGRYVRTA